MDYEIRESKHPGRTYLVWRKQIETKNISDEAMWKEAFAKVSAETKASGFEVNGPPAALYFSWDEASGKTDFAIGTAVEEAVDISDSELSIATVPESNACVVTVMGAYEELPKAHAAMMKYIDENGVDSPMSIEEYEITDYETTNIEEWKTTVYYLHE